MSNTVPELVFTTSSECSSKSVSGSGPTPVSKPMSKPVSKAVSPSWPTSPLAAAERAFVLLTRPPAALEFATSACRGMPRRGMPLDELRRLLISHSTTRPVRDLVWRELVARARRDGPAWVIAAVGMAMPGLRRAAGRLAAGWHGDTTDADAELLTGFLARLQTVDLDEPRICGRLIDAGVRAVKATREWAEDTDVVHVGGAWSVPPTPDWDHPDWVLTRAVALAVIDPDEYLLISATRLDDAPLRVVADKIGISVERAAAWRRKAERRLAEAIGLGELHWTPHALPQIVRRRAAARTAVSPALSPAMSPAVAHAARPGTASAPGHGRDTRPTAARRQSTATSETAA